MALLNFAIIMGALMWVAAFVWYVPLRKGDVRKAWSRKLDPDPSVHVFAVTSPEHAKLLFKHVSGGAYRSPA